MIQNGDNSIRDRIKSDVLQEVQRVLLTYEERIAVLEKENRLLWEENRKLCIALDDLTLSIDAFEEEMKAKINDALSNLDGALIFWLKIKVQKSVLKMLKVQLDIKPKAAYSLIVIKSAHGFCHL